MLSRLARTSLRTSKQPLLVSRPFSTTLPTRMKVIPVPCRSDNYMYILQDEATGKAAVFDPYDPVKLQAAADKEGIKIGEYLLTTHHHNDHSGGNEAFIAEHKDAKVYAGSDKSPGATNILKHKDTFSMGNLKVTALHTPCHTQDHICYYVEDAAKNERGVFTGDTLFVSGCGRFFEGTPQEMHVALNEILAKLPDDTKTYVGHEYTASNVAFSKSIDPGNKAIQELVAFCTTNDVTTGIFTIGDEKSFNVFMRTESEVVQEKAGTKDPIEAMRYLREAKNSFRG
ncbi:beta-lactamase-like protein [Leucosporidium creatinivorum]|uniref:hydroxyacylglutathione hydrolase n=1 Tax=Leucosporidium creatinivorum TaxID=106004 RepID=A0A1Y2G4R1_9BASI|nr:beta-lactamase-like protein [Leucosporidium creatinivorum]